MPSLTPTSKPRRAIDRRRETYREAVCEAAEALFGDRGVEATKMDDIANESGLSIATVYSTFRGGKAEIVASIHERRLADLVGFATHARAAKASPRERLENSVRQAVYFFVEHESYLRMHLREGHAWCMPEAIASRTRKGAEGFHEGVGAMIDIIQEGCRSGAFSTDNARRAGKAAVVLQQLHLAEWIEDGQRQTAEELFARYWQDVEAVVGIPAPKARSNRRSRG